MRLLTGGDISSILRNLTPDNARQLLNALSSGLASYYREQNAAAQETQNRIIQPARVVFQSSQKDGSNTVLTMPVSDTSSTVVKVATVPAKGDIAGATTIYSGETGQLQGVLNAAEITAFRTALASMTILTRWSAPQNPRLCVFGGGKQAEWHLRLALLLIPGIQHVTVVNRSKKRLEDFERNVLAELRDSHTEVGFDALSREGTSDEVYQKNLSEHLAEADIICCCTPSTEPLFSVKHLQGKEGSRQRFMSLIGSYKPHMQEIDTETLMLSRASGKIWVDSKEACLDEAGELIKAGCSDDDLEEIGGLFAEEGGEKATLAKERELTLFKCVGFGFMDLVISKALLGMAEKEGVGMVVEAF